MDLEQGKMVLQSGKVDVDNKSPEKYTHEELNKSFDNTIKCLTFTTETQNDFEEKTVTT